MAPTGEYILYNPPPTFFIELKYKKSPEPGILYFFFTEKNELWTVNIT